MSTMLLAAPPQVCRVFCSLLHTKAVGGSAGGKGGLEHASKNGSENTMLMSSAQGCTSMFKRAGLSPMWQAKIKRAPLCSHRCQAALGSRRLVSLFVKKAAGGVFAANVYDQPQAFCCGRIHLSTCAHTHTHTQCISLPLGGGPSSRNLGKHAAPMFWHGSSQFLKTWSAAHPKLR